MLNRKNRLRDKNEIEEVLKTGSVTKTPFFSFYYKKTKGPSKATAVVGTKVSKGANKRNLIKRRIKSILRELVTDSPEGISMVVVAKKEVLDTDFNKIEQEIKEAAKNVI